MFTCHQTDTPALLITTWDQKLVKDSVVCDIKHLKLPKRLKNEDNEKAANLMIAAVGPAYRGKQVQQSTVNFEAIKSSAKSLTGNQKKQLVKLLA